MVLAGRDASTFSGTGPACSWPCPARYRRRPAGVSPASGAVLGSGGWNIAEPVTVQGKLTIDAGMVVKVVIPVAVLPG